MALSAEELRARVAAVNQVVDEASILIRQAKDKANEAIVRYQGISEKTVDAWSAVNHANTALSTALYQLALSKDKANEYSRPI